MLRLENAFSTLAQLAAQGNARLDRLLALVVQHVVVVGPHLLWRSDVGNYDPGIGGRNKGTIPERQREMIEDKATEKWKERAKKLGLIVNMGADKPQSRPNTTGTNGKAKATKKKGKK